MKSNDFAAAPQAKVKKLWSKDREDLRHFLLKWRLSFSQRSFWRVSLMTIVTVYLPS